MCNETQRLGCLVLLDGLVCHDASLPVVKTKLLFGSSSVLQKAPEARGCSCVCESFKTLAAAC